MRTITKLTCLTLLLASGSAFGQAGQIDSTPHDMATGTTSSGADYGATTDNGQICVYCHTPHKSSDTLSPLWNHSPTEATFTMYDSDHSATMDMVVGSEPGPSSLACLSCHDGTIAVDSITNTPAGWAASAGTLMHTDYRAGEGADLTSDHPIAVTYDNTTGTNGDPDFVSLTTVKNTLPFYGASANVMECGTCHDPHDNDTAKPFLRLANTDSDLCLTCHIK